MKKSLFFKFFLFAVIGTMVTFTSCKNYDDDIESLNDKIANLSGIKTSLETAVADLKTSVAAAQASATAAQATADAAKALAQQGADALTVANGAKDAADQAAADAAAAADVAADAKTVADAAQAAADAAAAAAADAVAAGGSAQDAAAAAEASAAAAKTTAEEAMAKAVLLEADIVDLKARIVALEAADNASQADLDAVAADVAILNAEVQTLLGNTNRLLRSLVLIPHFYANGIEAIGFNPLQYYCYGSENLYLANPKNVTVKYHVNPSSITKDMIDVDNLSFTYKLQEHKTRSAAINAKAEFVSLVDGILTVRVDLDANKAEAADEGVWGTSGTHKLDMIALQVPLSAKAKNGETDYDAIVTSDWAKVDVDPLTGTAIDRIGWLCAKDAYSYSGSYSTVSAAKGETDPYLLELVYDKEYDLLDFVTSTALTGTSCGEFDPAIYGLVWNFDLLDENNDVIEYVLTSNDTEQQEFINLLNNQGAVKAKVYDATPGAGVTDAIGRTPIVRVQLIDPATKCVVEQGFVKIKWVKEQPRLDVEYPGVKVDFSCEANDTTGVTTMGLKIKTKWMNTNVMNALGTYYQEFIHNYKLDVTGLYDADGNLLTGVDAWGVVVPNPDAQEGEPEVTDLFSVYLSSTCEVVDQSSFTGYVHYTDVVSGEVSLTIKVTLDINMPTLTVAGHNNTYWQGGNNSSNVFNVNPVQYLTAPQINPTANYRTDLLNGFTNGTTYTDDISKIVKSSIAGHTPCDVEFVFDAVALKSYSFVIDGVTYKTANNNLRVSANGKNLEFLNGTTWTVASYIAYTNPMPGLTHAGEAIHLNESGQDANVVYDSWPHKFAQALVGKKVPVKLAANLCCNTECDLSRDIRKFEVYFIPPMHINSTLSDSFEDWVVGGDYIQLDKAFTLTDFAGYLVSQAADDLTAINVKNRYTLSLLRYYEIRNLVWDVANATSNIANVGGDLDVVAGANNALPDNYLVTYLDATDTTNPNSLRFQNNSGAPLAKEFELYVPVTVDHKWGTLKTTVTIKVLPPQ